MQNLNIINNKIANLLRVVTVAEVDFQSCLVKVAFCGIKSDWVPCLAKSAGNSVSYIPPLVDEQGLLLSPNGDINSGVYIPGVYQDKHKPEAPSESKTTTKYKDGTTIDYDTATNELNISSPASLKINIESEQIVLKASSIKLDSDVTITGTITAQKEINSTGTITSKSGINATGTIHSDTNLTTSTISVNTHVHVLSIPSGTTLPPTTGS